MRCCPVHNITLVAECVVIMSLHPDNPTSELVSLVIKSQLFVKSELLIDSELSINSISTCSEIYIAGISPRETLSVIDDQVK